MLTDKHRKIARRLSRQYDIDGMTREDIEQEALLVILQCLKDGVPDEHIFNKVRTHLHNLTRRPEPRQLGDRDLRVVDPQGEDHVDDLDDADEYDATIAPYLNLVTPRQAEVLRLTYVDGLSDDEIAERLGVKRCAVHRYRSDGLARIRAAVVQSEKDE